MTQVMDRRSDVGARGLRGAAWRVSHDDGQPRVEALGRELDAAHLRRRDDIARDADDEQVAETLAEDELGRNARIGTAEHDGERLLAGAGTASRASPVCNEAPISVTQARQRFLSRDQNRTPAPSRSVRGGTRDRTRP